MATEPTWPPQRLRELRRLYEQAEPRLSREEIATILQTTFCAVRNALSRHRIARPNHDRGRGFPRGTVRLSAPVPEHDDPDNPAAMPSGRESRTRHRIRCLGPGEPRGHLFWSDDARSQRVCERCRRLMAGVVEQSDL